MNLANLSDQELLSSLSAICFETRRLLGRLLLHLIEVEERRLDLRSACSSLYDFCLRRLHMSESEAVRRIEAARLVKRFPALLGHLERGDINLTAMLLLRRHFTAENVDELVEAVRGKPKLKVLELLAAGAPASDALPMISALGGASPSPDAASGGEPGASLPGSAAPRTAACSASALPSPAPAAAWARLEPVSATRYLLEVAIGRELRDKIERARALARHRLPDGKLEALMDMAFDTLLAKLEKERLGKTARPQRARRSAKPGTIPRAVLREVYARDGEQCTFTDDQGNRCNARDRLELDHILSRALGGADTAENLRVRCRPHNRLHAEEDFGRELIDRRIHLRQRRRRRLGVAPVSLPASPGATGETPRPAPAAGGGTSPSAGADIADGRARPGVNPDIAPPLVRSAGHRRRQELDELAADVTGPAEGRGGGPQGAAPPCAEESLELARRALVKMGFRAADVRCALLRVQADFAAPPPIAELLRSALAVLTR